MKSYYRIAIGIVIFVTGSAFTAGFNVATEATNEETFCISCHEMKQTVYQEYQGTIHDSNTSGIRATCHDCHVPKEWLPKMIRKINAASDLYHHYMGTIDTLEKFEARRLLLAKIVWKDMTATDSRECRSCHAVNMMDFTEQDGRAARKHKKAEEKGETCIDCHKGIAHTLPEGYEEDEAGEV